MANKQVTINEMVYNTLRTKIDKIPKYYDILTALGYELINDGEWSVQNYWEIKTKVGDRLCISKGYDNKTYLYLTATRVRCYDIKKVDFVNLILMNEKKKNNRLHDFRWSYNTRTPRIEKYFQLKVNMRHCKDMLEICARNTKKARAEYESLKEQEESYLGKLIQAQNDFLDFKDELRGTHKNSINN